MFTYDCDLLHEIYRKRKLYEATKYVIITSEVRKNIQVDIQSARAVVFLAVNISSNPHL